MTQVTRVSAFRRRIEGYIGSADGTDQPLSVPIVAVNRAIVAFVSGQTNVPTLVRNGQSFTLVRSEVTIGATIHAFILVNPNVGTFDIVVTRSAFDKDLQIDAQVFSDVHQTTPVASSNSVYNAFASTPYSLAATVPGDGVVVAGMSTRKDDNSGSGYDATPVSPGVISGNTDGACKLTAGYLDATGSTSFGFTWTPTSQQIASLLTVVLAPAVAAAEEVPPVQGGSLVASAIGETGYTLGWTAATDNVGVVGYEYSTDGGSTWVAVGNVLTTPVTGRTAGTTDQARLRAFDAAGNRSNALSLAVTLLTADVTVPTMQGAIAVSDLTNSGYKLSWQPATDNVAVTGYERSVDGGTTYADVGNVLTTTVTGRTPSSTDATRVRAYDAKGNKSTPLSQSVNLPATTDATAPVMSGAIAITNKTTTGYTATWSAATDAVGVVGYERSLDGGSSYQAIGNVLTTSPSGRTPGSTDQLRIRAYDIAGNRSNVLSSAVTLDAAQTGQVTTAVMLNASKSPLADTAVVWEWVAAGRIGSVSGKQTVEGVGTTNNLGRLTVPGLPVGAGRITYGVLGATSADDRISMEYLTAA